MVCTMTHVLCSHSSFQTATHLRLSRIHWRWLVLVLVVCVYTCAVTVVVVVHLIRKVEGNEDVGHEDDVNEAIHHPKK